jgi:lysine 6-dehydrogenase
MRYTVLGAGMMGSAVAYDLAVTYPGEEVVLADLDGEAAAKSAKAIGPNVRPLQLDVNNLEGLASALRGSSVVVSAVSYAVNELVTRAAIQAGVHMVDLGGNNDIARRQMALDRMAKDRGVTIVPNNGLAPGLINILALTAAGEFEALDSIHLRVGGLPQHPRPPLGYQIVFSVEGLINEYVEKAVAIRNGDPVLVDSMSELEEIAFPAPFGTLEAFQTSGGLSTLPEILSGKVRNLDYKTIRYKGHCEKFKTLLDLGFATSEPLMLGGTVKTNREFFAELLRKKLDFGDKDVVLARATVTGQSHGTQKTLVHEFIDYFDDATQMTAMMRTTAFPASITAAMLAHGAITARGVMPPELCVPGALMIEELGRRNITITRTVTEMRS